MAPPPSFTWSVDAAAGSIDAAGLFTAALAEGGPYTVTASSGGKDGTATVTVVVSVLAPTVANGIATGVTTDSATLNGTVTDTGGEDPEVHVCWGSTDEGITGGWDNDVNLGTLGLEPFSTALSSLSPGTTYYFRCYGTNAGGTAWAASTASFSTAPLPAVIVDPQDVAVYEGEAASFSVTATGTGTLHYQWREDGTPVGGDGDTYNIAAAATSQNGHVVYCEVTDDYATVQSGSATLTVSPAPPADTGGCVPNTGRGAHTRGAPTLALVALLGLLLRHLACKSRGESARDSNGDA